MHIDYAPSPSVVRRSSSRHRWLAVLALVTSLSGVAGTVGAAPATAQPAAGSVAGSAAGSADLASADEPPGSGTVLLRRGSGRGELVVDNRTGSDAIVTLADSGRAVLRLLVRGGTTATASRVPDGRYEIFSVGGTGWDRAPRSFAAESSALRLDRRAVFSSERTDSGVRYSRNHLTLHAVEGGNTLVRPIEPNDVPR